MKVLLMVPAVNMTQRYGRFAPATGSTPILGLGYIAAVLEKEDHDIQIIDGLVESFTLRELMERIKKFRPDVFGISTTSLTYIFVKDLAKEVKNRFPKIKIIIGGPHVSSMPLQTMKSKVFDIGVIGEGEKTISEVIRNIQKGRSLKNVKGVFYLTESGRVKQNQPRELIKNLDEIPFPARHLFPPLSSYRPSIFYYKKLPMTTQMTSRGCPYGCIFCGKPVFGRTYRTHSPKYVVDEMKLLKEKFGVKEIMFYDDIFTIDKKRVMEICGEILKRDLRLLWSIGTRVDAVDKEMLEAMAQTGCWNIGFGIETGNQQVMKFINKGIDLKKVKKAVVQATKAGIQVRGLFMLAHPTDTLKTMEDTINLAKSLPFYSVNFSITHPIINTKLYEIAPQYGGFDKSRYFESFSGHPSDPVFIPYGLTKKQILDTQRRAYLEFYLSPQRIWLLLKSINSWTDIKKYFQGLKVIVGLLVSFITRPIHPGFSYFNGKTQRRDQLL